MVLRLTTVKCLLWFCAILLLVLSFPIQVYTNSPYPSLLPFFLIVLIVLSDLLSSRKNISPKFTFRQYRNIDLIVGIYLFLVLFHTSWQTIFEVISFVEAMNALAIYVLPITFYWYFRSEATEREIRWVLSATIVGGLIVGIYFAYDSYLKLGLGQVSDYAKLAFQYSLDRGTGNIEDANTARINLGSRSHGLLQSHTASGAWVALGAFAALALIPVNRRVLRRASIFAFGTMLLLGLNFSSIIAFVIVILLFEFDGLTFLRGSLSHKLLGNLVSFLVVLAIIVGTVFWVVGDSMLETMLRIVSIQKDILLTTGAGNTSMVGIVAENTAHYLRHILDLPLTLLFGDGFSAFGYGKGGDTGHIELLAQFGLPFYLVVLLGFFSLITSGIRRIKALRISPARETTDLNHPRIIQFAICVTSLILIMESHYSVWGAKSILPIVFFVLALFGRYQSARNHRCF